MFRALLLYTNILISYTNCDDTLIPLYYYCTMFSDRLFQTKYNGWVMKY